MAKKYRYIVEREGEKGWEVMYDASAVQPALSMMRDWAGEGYPMRLTQIPDGKRTPKPDAWSVEKNAEKAAVLKIMEETEGNPIERDKRLKALAKDHQP